MAKVNGRWSLTEETLAKHPVIADMAKDTWAANVASSQPAPPPPAAAASAARADAARHPTPTKSSGQLQLSFRPMPRAAATAGAAGGEDDAKTDSVDLEAFGCVAV